MEHISQHLPESLQAQTSLSKVSDKTFSQEPEENEMMTLKYKSKPFGSMSLPDLTKWAKALLAKISVVTGWINPENEILNILVDQFSKKLVESYAKVNPDEMEYAFRQVGTTVKDWGKSVNLSLIDEVMIPYLQKRFELSRVEEQKKVKMIENKENISDQELWESTSFLVKKTGYPVLLIPESLYDWKNKQGLITTSVHEKREYLDRAILFRHGLIKNEFEKNSNSLEKRENLIEFEKMLSTKLYSKSEHEYIKGLAKKIVVFDMMKQGL